jgi:PBP1b-binding outer membrane lipoprotein LpoB
MKIIAAALVAMLMAGCASPDYAVYAQAKVAQSLQEEKRLESIALIARESTSDAAKIAGLIMLSHAEQKASANIEKPTNIMVESAQVITSLYGTWAQTLLGVLQLRRSTTAISEQDAANAVNILQPSLK